jgi:hypothetical protein
LTTNPHPEILVLMEQINYGKKLLSKSQNIIIISFILIVFLGMVGGIIVMSNNGKTKVQSIRMIAIQKPGTSERTNTQLTVQPTLDPTINWQTYITKSYSIKYPSRFAISQNQLPYSVIYSKIYSSVIFSDDQNLITITAAKNSSNYSLNSISGNGPQIRYASTLIPNNGQKIIKIGSIEALLTQHLTLGQNGTALDIILIENAKVYQFTLSPLNADPATFMAMLNTFKTLNQEPDDITDNWQIAVDNNYGFTFKYPLTYGLDHGKSATISALTMVFDADKTQVDAPEFRIEVQDARNLGQSDYTSKNLLNLPLDQYVNKKWGYAKNASDAAVPNITTSALMQTIISGKLAYQFNVSGEYSDDRGTERLNTKYLYVFTQNAGYKYKIWFPEGDIIFNQILKTLTFTR